jgi:RHS repeat-associated protein
MTAMDKSIFASMDYLPFGEQISGGSTTTRKFTGKERDSESNLDNFGARYYTSQMGRMMSSDPLGGHLFDPQTLNKYSYVRNNPLALVDPTGLDGELHDDRSCDPGFCDSWLAAGSAARLAAWTNGGNTSDWFGGSGSPGSDLLTDAENWSPFDFEFSGTLYGKGYSGVFNTWDEYASWRTGIAALPESQTYMVFAALCKNQGCDPNRAYSVQSQYWAMVYNVTLNGHQVDKSNLDAWWSDPVTFLHGGKPSWYQGYFLDTPHMIATQQMSGHIDPFGPFNPLHYLIQIPSMVIPSGPNLTGTCALVGGCALK